MTDHPPAADRVPGVLAGLIAYIIGVLPPLAIHQASGAGGLGHIHRGEFIVVGLLTVLPVGIAFGWLTYRHLRVASRYAGRRTSEAWASFFAGISVFSMLAALLPVVIWWRMVNDDTSISDRGAWFYLAWVGGYALAISVGVLVQAGIFGARKVTRLAHAESEAPAAQA